MHATAAEFTMLALVGFVLVAITDRKRTSKGSVLGESIADLRRTDTTMYMARRSMT